MRPPDRGRGLCDRVMQAMARGSLARKFDFGLLFCIEDFVRVYERCGWIRLEPRDNERTHEQGDTVPVPPHNVTMFLPVTQSDFPKGSSDLQGNDR